MAHAEANARAKRGPGIPGRAALRAALDSPAAKLAGRHGEKAVLVLLAVLVIGYGQANGTPTGVLATGVVNGALIAAGAVCVVLAYRASGFINFAQMQLVAAASGLFCALVNGMGVAHVLSKVTFGWISVSPRGIEGGWAAYLTVWVTTVVLVLFVVPGIVWLLHITLFQRFATRPKLIATLVTVFLAQALVAAMPKLADALKFTDSDKLNDLAPKNAGSEEDTITRPVALPLRHADDFSWKLNGATLSAADLLVIIVAVLAVLGLWAYLRYSKGGVAVRAAAENPERARSLGVNSAAAVGRAWIAVGIVIALLGILQASRSGAPVLSDKPEVQAIAKSFVPIVGVLAAAAMGGFSSILRAAASGVLLGLGQQCIQFKTGNTVLFDALLVVAIVVALFAQRVAGTRESDASSVEKVAEEPRPIPAVLKQVPAVRRWMATGGWVLGTGAVALPWLVDAGRAQYIGGVVVFAMIGMSVLVLIGWAGQVSLGQFGFAAIGAWVAAVSELPLPLAVLAAGVVGALLSVLLGLPAMRLTGLHLAVVSLAFAMSMQQLLFAKSLLGDKLPNTISRPAWFGIDFGNPRSMYYLVLAAFALTVLAVVGLRRSRTGRALIAVRSNPHAAQSFGISPLKVKLQAFAFSGFIAAAAGALYIFQQGTISQQSFTVDASLTVVMYAVLGGLGGVAGPILGFTFYTLLYIWSDNQIITYSATGIGAIMLLLAMPGGLGEALYRARDQALRRIALRFRIPVPSLLGDRAAALMGEQALLGDVKGTAARPPLIYKPEGQWALDRYGKSDATKERIGV